MLNFDIILASASPRRKAILSQVDLDFTIEPSKINEDFSIELLPKAFCEYWAREKANYVARSHLDKLIIGADTIVVIDDKILGKPKSYKESFEMLKSLSGKTHQVLTGVSLIHLNLGINFTFNEATDVSFCFLTDEEINKYIDKYQPYDKAGSYGIQDGFSVYVEKINGCFYNVMGFPISRFHKFYRDIAKGDILID
ncbi:MAG: Maf family protein [Candidatus Neomarinimicrobiota bacterium]